jgi:hypothetical protein
MKIITSAPLLAALGAASASFAQPTIPAPAPPAPPPPPVAQAVPEPDIHTLRPAFVPLVALPLDMSQASDPIWVTGDRPARNIIARLTLKPLDTVVVEQNLDQGEGKKLVLMRALTGDPTRFATTEAIGASAQRIYCADGLALGEPGRIPCFEDRDGDGDFDNRIYGLGETGAKAEQLSILAAPIPLPSPVRYRPATAAEAPEIKTLIVNCGKDHDRPLYSFDVADRSTSGANLNDLLQAMTLPGAGGDAATQAQRMSELTYATARGACLSAERVREGDSLHPGAVPKGNAIARLGEIVIAVGAKEEGAPVRLLGLREPKRLYRINYGSVQAVSEEATRKQKALALEQKFDRPVLVAAAAGEAAEGRHIAGDTILTVPFRHGYMGVLTQDTVIRTLFSKRSLPKGTLLYGVPMSMRTITTYGGKPLLPDSMFGGVPDPDQVALVWCVPVQDEAEWSATCLPHQGAAGRYTLLKGQRPAFEVTSMRYAAGTSTNEGEVPVEMQEGDFGKPLAYRFRIKSATAGELVLTQDTMFGDEVVNSKELHIPRLAGKMSGLSFGGGMISFSEVEGAPDAVLVKQVRPARVGAAALAETGLLDKRGPIPSPPLPVPAPTEPKPAGD